MPEYSQTQLQISGNGKYVEALIDQATIADRISASVQTENQVILSEWALLWEQVTAGNISQVLSPKLVIAILHSSKQFFLENTMILLTVLAFTILVFTMFWFLYSRVRIFKFWYNSC